MNKLDIINNAMLKAGLPLAASLADCDYNALHVYDLCVEECLASRHWSFARRHATLPEVENERGFGKSRAYQLPEDYLAKVDIRGNGDTRSPGAACEIAGRILYCDISPCHLRYTARVTDPSAWPASFCETVSALIACKIAALSAEKMSLTPQLLQYYNLQLSIAASIDARESTGSMPGDRANPYINARKEAGGD